MTDRRRRGSVRILPRGEGRWALFGRGTSFLVLEDRDEMLKVCQVLADKLDELNGYPVGD